MQRGRGLDTGRGPAVRRLVLVAAAAALFGAVVGSGATLLIAKRGPQGQAGTPGARGPRGFVGGRGPRGASGAGATLSFRLDDLENRISDLENTVGFGPGSAPDLSTGLDDLDSRVFDLENKISNICISDPRMVC